MAKSSQDAAEQTSSTLWTPANVVTCVRIGLVPVFMAVIISPWPDWVPYGSVVAPFQPWIAALLFALISCTDALDGYLARSRGEVTDFGKFVDPLADKILVAAALLALCELGQLPSWVALVIICREFIISGLRMLAATKGVVIAASWYGKAKTVTTIIAILMFIIKNSVWMLYQEPGFVLAFYLASWAFMLVAVALTIWSMIDYFVKAADVFKSTGKLDEELILDAEHLASKVVKEATARELKLSTAESCTGGLIAGALTCIPGSSSVVEGGIVSYSNEVKKNSLGVSADDLESFGAVSEPVALQMAEGSRNALCSDIAVSVTGIAGPGGGSKEKPVGTVWFGVSSKLSTHAELCHFSGDRASVREQTVIHALTLMRAEIQKF